MTLAEHAPPAIEEAHGVPARRIRVLQVALTLNPGGTERLICELVRRLSDRASTAVCCLDEIGTWGMQLAAEGVSVESLHRKPGFRPSLGWALGRMAARHRADVIHAHQYSPFVYAALGTLRYARARLIFTEHGRLGNTPPSPKRARANFLFARLPDRTFAVSHDLKDHLVAEGFPARNVGVVYNGIDVGPLPSQSDRVRVRRALGVSEHSFVVVTVARLDPVKDLRTLIDAGVLLADIPALQMLIVGDGPERRALEEYAAARGIGPRVLFTGHRDDARELLACGDVFVNCSVFEGVSLTILEAMAAGIPVVGTAVGGTPEVLAGDAGCLVPAGHAQELATAVRDLYRDSTRRAAIAAAGRARVERQFTIDGMITRYFDVYRSLL